MNNDWIRKDFSLLDDNFYYFNNASTSLKPNCVMHSIDTMLTKHDRDFLGDYQNSDFVTEKILECRQLVAKLIHCEAEEVIFTSNCTDSLDRLAQLVNVKEGDNIVCSILDHNANFIPWMKKGANVLLLKTLENGLFDLDMLESFLKNNTVKIVSLVAMSNTAGIIQPFKKIVEIAHKYGTLVCIDFAQYIPHYSADFKSTDCDFCCFSAHKIGSTCFGVLVGKKNVLERCREDIYAKNLKSFFDNNDIPLKNIPVCFEFGSLQIFDIIAFSSALKYFISLGYDTINEFEGELRDYFLQKAKQADFIQFLFPMQQICAPIFTFNFSNTNLVLSDVNKILLNDYRISVSCGTQCAQPLYKNLGYKMGMRASCTFYNTKDEIDYLFDKLALVAKK